MVKSDFVPYSSYREYPPEEMKRRAVEFHREVGRRRPMRGFSDREVPREVVERALLAAGTDEHKPFLERAPYLIAIFERKYGLRPDGTKFKHYYVTESVGIATGILITALHQAGLATLTHTPSPMGFLNELLKRPENERPFLLLVTGYPARAARIPQAALRKKPLSEIATFLD